MLALPLQTLDVSSKTLFIFNCIYFKPSSGSITPPPPSSPPILLHLCLRPQIRDRHRWCDPRRAFHTSTPACLVNISTFLSRRASSPPLSHPPLSDKPPEGEPGTVKLSFMASLLWMCNLCFGSLLLQLIVFFHKMFFFFFFLELSSVWIWSDSSVPRSHTNTFGSALFWNEAGGDFYTTFADIQTFRVTQGQYYCENKELGLKDKQSLCLQPPE